MEISITQFAERHFDPKFGATKILDMSINEVVSYINSNDVIESLKLSLKKNVTIHIHPGIKVMPGYAPFCKLLAIRNFTDARVGSLPITLENYQYIHSGYSARTEDELPIFSRWLQLPVSKPIAKWLIFVLYDIEQLRDEHYTTTTTTKTEFNFTADYGVVAILGQTQSNEEPMKPETMLRNALGKIEGGSGVPIDREKYIQSVEFWSKNVTLK